MALTASEAAAKTVVQITPTSGPPGSTVTVDGFGFADGGVTIAVAAADRVAGGFVDELPADQWEPLAKAPVVDGGIHATVSLQDARFLDEPEVDVLAIQADPPSSEARYFVAKATFDMTPAALADAGTGPYDSGDSALWLAASLAAFGVVLTLGGLRLRATTAR